MDLLEYQGKQLFAKHGVPVPEGRPAATVQEAVEAAEALGYPCVIKAQVLIGGRGKAGGIKVANDRKEAEEHAQAILGMDIRGFTVHEAWVEEEAMLVEVNPLIITGDRKVVALDAKVTLDDNSLFRHPDNAELRNPGAEDPQEQMAKERGLTYVKLDGDVGILGNGAGLVMSTLDVVAQAGGSP